MSSLCSLIRQWFVDIINKYFYIYIMPLDKKQNKDKKRNVPWTKIIAIAFLAFMIGAYFFFWIRNVFKMPRP
jgi:uncharacterized membrane protein YsdA (DUF1294 family)